MLTKPKIKPWYRFHRAWTYVCASCHVAKHLGNVMYCNGEVDGTCKKIKEAKQRVIMEQFWEDLTAEYE